MEKFVKKFLTVEKIWLEIKFSLKSVLLTQAFDVKVIIELAISA